MKKILFWTGFVVAMDQISKFLITAFLNVGTSFDIIPGIFSFTHVRNTGIAFGLAKGFNWLFIVISIAVVCLILIIHKKILIYFSGKQYRISTSFVLGCFIGGALGNLIDRIFRGSVVDFFDFKIWPVFNIADSCITIVLIIIAYSLLQNAKLK